MLLKDREMDLVKKSIQILKDGQTADGSFIACENFGNYRYSWFRDGSYIASALLEYGYTREAYKFIEWGAMVVNRYQEKMESCILTFQHGGNIAEEDFFHTRFTLDGYEVPGHWGFNQFDGLGTWLWFTCKVYMRDSQLIPSSDVINALNKTAEYISIVWPAGCSDCWEENEGRQHTYTLASIVAGLREYCNWSENIEYKKRADSVLKYLKQNCLTSIGYIKSVGLNVSDANLIGLCEPYNIVAWDDSDFQKTLLRIENELMSPGLHRFLADTYYGGGEWVLLTAWIGLLYAKHGRIDDARKLKTWIESVATPEGFLAEQVPQHLFAPEKYAQWEKDAGEIATPLLWSHAMYLLLVKEIDTRN